MLLELDCIGYSLIKSSTCEAYLATTYFSYMYRDLRHSSVDIVRVIQACGSIPSEDKLYGFKEPYLDPNNNTDVAQANARPLR